jgi:ribosomal protein L11 methylase PrmA
LTSYLRYTYLVPEEIEELATAELWALGTLGVELAFPAPGEIRFEAYFEDLPSAPAAPLLEPVWKRRGVRLLDRQQVPAQDWLASYRELVQPFALGRGFLIDPREPAGPAGSGGQETAGGGQTTTGGGQETAGDVERARLRIPARQAFGIGTHASTRLVVELLEQLPLQGRRVLDVGTGTGILAFVALLLGARLVVGFDSDVGAAILAQQNKRLNRLGTLFFAGKVEAIGSHRRYDLALVNVIPEEILPEMPRILALLEPGARLILSGVLRERGAGVLRQLTILGLSHERTVVDREQGEWIAFVARRRGQPPALHSGGSGEDA